MADTARVVVLKATDLLAERLEPIISARLTPYLGKSSWTELLAELDAMRGNPRTEILAHDLRSQLRVMSERLNSLQFPFDKGKRKASAIASELLNVQHSLVSNSPFSWLDAARATDLAVRLLEALDDHEGVSRAVQYRRDALLEHSREVDGTPRARDDSPSATAAPPKPSPVPEPASRGASAPRKTPEPPADSGLRAPYTPWPGRQAGDSSVLETLRNRDSAARVRALAQEIIDHEWPIEIERLCQEVIRSFGVTRAYKDRIRKVRQTILRSSVHIDDDGFLWPSADDRTAWASFRYDPPGTARPFEEISVIEIRNAIAGVQREHPDATEAQQKQRVLAIFGRERQTAGVKSRLSRAWQ